MLQLATDRPEHADLLRAMERRVAEASVALRVRGTPDVPDEVPQLAATQLVSVRIAPDGTVRDSEPVEIDGSSADPDAVGYRLRVSATTAVPDGATLSGRLTVGGIEQPGFDVDVAWPAGADEATLELLTPYGRAHYAVDPGAYELHVYLDGKTVATLAWDVPAARGPALHASLEDLIAHVRDQGWACTRSTTDESVTEGCQASTGPARFAVQVSHTSDGALLHIQLVATRDDGSAVFQDARPFFGEMLQLIYGDAQGDDLMTWVEQRNSAFGQIRARGTWLQSSAEGQATRWLTILPQQPA
jgi:hypothetical protein